MDQNTSRKAATLAELDAALKAMQLEGHWHNREGPPAPSHAVAARPYLWRWRELHARLTEACALVGVDRGASRRTLRLCTPGLPVKAATHSIHASLQIVTAGEVARAHRHSNNAFRFIIQGSPLAYTNVEGERFGLSRHDLILTPPWTWHDHVNEGSEPVCWIDGHDLPLMRSLSTEFFESHPHRQQAESHPSGYWRQVARMEPRHARAGGIGGIPYVYSGAEQLAALHALGPEAHDASEGIVLDYANPLTGGPTMPTIACRLHRLRAGEVTKRRRHTASTIYHVVAGQGTTVAGATRLDWHEGDLLVVPNWTWYRHETGSQDAILFSASDDPLFKAIDQYRTEAESDEGATTTLHQGVSQGADR
jgi:gentisate 1,2-dioxygenase